MKPEIKLFFAFTIILFIIMSCGTATIETVSPVIPNPATGQYTRVVVLPFSDYTLAFSSYGHWRRNIIVHEAVQDELFRAGYIPVAEEEVERYLLSRRIIQASYEVSPETAALQRELDGEWSDQMRLELEKAILENLASYGTEKKRAEIERLASVNTRMVKDLGRSFGAEYVVRGRIVEFRYGQEDTFDPFKTGILPFVLKLGRRTVFGVSQTDTYESIDMAAIGGTMRRAVAESDFPFKDPYSDKNAYKWINRVIWGVGSYTAGLFGDEQGRVPKVTVQLKMLVQNAKTGEIVWLNRSEVRATPLTAYAEHDRHVLALKAVKRAVRSLVDNFVATQMAGGIVTVDKEGVTISPKVEEAEAAAAEAKKAAAEAKKAAQEAKEAAADAGEAAQEADEESERTERIFEKIMEK
jgi:hypothetical protein